MDNAIHLTDVQQLNLNFLLTIQAGLKHDRIAASYKFHLDPDCAALLGAMNASDLVALAANMPHESLFQPIGNLSSLLAAPHGLAVTLCTVGAGRPNSSAPNAAVAAANV